MNKEEPKKKIKYNQLPVHLQKKYKNSPLFAKENLDNRAKFDFDVHKLKARKA